MSSKTLRVLSIIPPMSQLNTPYPAVPYLTGFLRSRGIDAVQEDMALALALRLFSEAGLTALRNAIGEATEGAAGPCARAFCERFARYRATVNPVVAFLQGRDPTLASRICGRDLLPEGPRFESLEAFEEEEGGDPLSWAFGALGVQDRAKHLATLYLNDIADVCARR